MRVPMLLEAQKLSEEGEIIFIDTYYDKLLHYYIEKYCMRWLIAPSDLYFEPMKKIAEIDNKVLPNADLTFGKWPSGKAPGLGPGDREFESRLSDHFYHIPLAEAIRLSLLTVTDREDQQLKEVLLLSSQQQLINGLRHQRNTLSQEGPKNAERVREIKEKVNLLEEELNNLEEELNNLTSQIPNLPAPDTPTNEEGNRVIDKIEYQHAIRHNLTHEQILKNLSLTDEEKSLLLSGSKFAVYQDFGSQLLHALINFMRSENSKRGYRLFDTPYLANGYNLYNTGQLPKFQEDLYKLENSSFYLIPTAEVSLVNLYRKQTLEEKNLPLKLCAYTPCFRAEAGAAGQENKGLIRLHQFHKVELVKIVKPEHSYQELKELLADARNILHLLKIPHRVIELCHQELGFTAAKTYDIEV
ncbi:13552_t:CDS:2 [Ambispora gerdemannii]|uniref:Serine--tRNA ligase n=1 Tax=Ambispora gerdemannii TaxID=144530 RepID=A0A9N9BU35_9GLOM|nr:13552_t:CDS:2 [Ambispora gerdemannii]